MIDHVHLHAKFVSGFQIVPRDEFFSDRDCPWAAQPSLKIKFSRVEIGRIESSKRRVCKNIDPEDFQIFARKIWQRHQASHERRRGGDASRNCDHREDCLGKTPGRRRNLEFRFASNHVDRGSKCAIRAVIGDLSREINRHPERNAQNIQEREQRMMPQVTEHVRSENAKILCAHPVPQSALSRRFCEAPSSRPQPGKQQIEPDAANSQFAKVVTR